MASLSWPGLYETFNMNFRHLYPSLALAALLSTPGALSARSTSPSGPSCSNPEYIAPHKTLRPLLDLISKGEGDYNAINRGSAGDTPGGIQGLKGYTFENFTVGQVIEMQRWELYAVGRYQFIPSTLRWAVAMSDVDELDMFTPEIQGQTGHCSNHV